MSFDSSRPSGLSPDDQLPPVQPPSAGFIVQLFVVPGVIVVVVVVIWLLFNWLAHKGNDRDAFVRDLSRNNEARWQAAFNLANALRAERGSKEPALATDHELAKQLAEILKRENTSGGNQPNAISLRIYLCRALGEFKVADGLPTLVEVAATSRDEETADVRRAALEGIALLSSNVDTNDQSFADHFTNNIKLQEVLLDAAGDSDPRTRSVAAVALGVIGTPPMLDRLKRMLEDANPDVRYNAATRLAAQGDAAALPGLVEMLDPDETAGIDTEKTPEMRPYKRALITLNALRAGDHLVEKNTTDDMSALDAAVDKLLATRPQGELLVAATNLKRQLTDRGAGK